MCDRCIMVEPYEASHSAEDMREQLCKLLAEYGLVEMSGTVLGDGEGDVEPYPHMDSDDESVGKGLIISYTIEYRLYSR